MIQSPDYHMIGRMLWRRLDCPGHEAAWLFADDAGHRLMGTAVFVHDGTPCRLDYQIVCDASWRSRSAKVEGMVGDGPVHVRLEAHADRWWLNGEECPGVEGCIDLDLNFSPSTNLLPIRRLSLDIGQEAAVKAAWLRFPDFTLEPLDQIYRRVHENTYRYESADGKFVANLQANGDGFVTLYPELWQAEVR
jgi:uncharacterized protein